MGALGRKELDDAVARALTILLRQAPRLTQLSLSQVRLRTLKICLRLGLTGMCSADVDEARATGHVVLETASVWAV